MTILNYILNTANNIFKIKIIKKIMSSHTETIELLKQSVAVVNQFLEKLRSEKDVNLLNLFSYQDITTLHVSMTRLNQFVSNLTVTQTEDQSMVETI